MRARQEPPGRDIAVASASAGGVDGGAIERGQWFDEVEQERAWLAAIVEQMPGGLVIASAPEGRVVVVNERARRMLGGLRTVRRCTEFAATSSGPTVPGTSSKSSRWPALFAGRESKPSGSK